MKQLPTSIVYAIQTALAKTASVIKGNLFIKLEDWDLTKMFCERLTKLSPIPTPPTTEDPANFDERADKFLSSLPNLQIELNKMIDELNALMCDTLVLNNNMEAINFDFKPNMEKAKEYMNEMLIKIELLRNDYEKNTAVLAGDKYTYSRAYLDDMFSKCIHILNHYTKPEIDRKFEGERSRNDEVYYLKSKIDELLSLKANVSEVYKKDEIYAKEQVDGKLANFANKNDVYRKVETYSINELFNKNEINAKFNDLTNSQNSLNAGKFLGKHEKAADSDKLDGLDSSAFVKVGDLTNFKNSIGTGDPTNIRRDLARIGVVIPPYFKNNKSVASFGGSSRYNIFFPPHNVIYNENTLDKASKPYYTAISSDVYNLTFVITGGTHSFDERTITFTGIYKNFDYEFIDVSNALDNRLVWIERSKTKFVFSIKTKYTAWTTDGSDGKTYAHRKNESKPFVITVVGKPK